MRHDNPPSRLTAHWRGMVATVGVNWLVKPFSMALLAWLFIGHLFRPLLPAGQIDSYIAGLILLAAAPCTAMVFVWSNLVEGEPNFTLLLVARPMRCSPSGASQDNFPVRPACRSIQAWGKTRCRRCRGNKGNLP